jgi:thymidylate synthase (FAD)
VEIKPLPDEHSFVRYIDHVGPDAGIVNAARISFHKEIEETGMLEAGDEALLRWLLKRKHGSPFEQGFMSRWQIRLPIFVMREWVRHRIGTSLNEESGRYVELRPHFYLPAPENVRTQVGKPGNYSFQPVDLRLAHEYVARLSWTSEHCYRSYQWALENGIAKELARLFLPLNLYTEIRWTCNARSLMNLLALRNHKDAMWEIRQYAICAEEIFGVHMPVTHSAFVENGRIAP